GLAHAGVAASAGQRLRAGRVGRAGGRGGGAGDGRGGRSGGLAGGHVVAVVTAEDGQRLVAAVLGPDGHEGPAGLELVLVVVGLLLGDAGPDQRARDP